jgi:hypothetical protein
MPLIRVTYEVDVPHGWLEWFEETQSEDAIDELREHLGDALLHAPASVELM